LLTENAILALAGGAAGLLVAAISTRLLFYGFKLVGEMYLPLRHVDAISMDGRIFVFALLISCLTGLLFGVAPAIAALRINLNEPLKEGGRTGGSGGHTRLRQVLVASEVALALVVLSGAGLMIKSMTRLLGVDPGLNAKNVCSWESRSRRRKFTSDRRGCRASVRISINTWARFQAWYR
jgi:hypothetical protein